MAWYNPKTWGKKPKKKAAPEVPPPITLEHFQEPAVDPAATVFIPQPLPPAPQPPPPRVESPPPPPPEFGSFVEVFLDYGFGLIVPCYNPAAAPFAPCLYIPDLPAQDAAAELAGKCFDWHLVPASYRATFQLGNRCLREPWAEVKQFLKDRQ